MIDLLAYIDPGTTALIFQILAGVFISFGLILGIWWKKISTKFKSIWAKITGKKIEENKTDDELSDELSDEEQKTETDLNDKEE